MYATPTETHNAKKQHRCEWCWQFIEADETYNRYRFYADGEAGTVKMHPECIEAMQEEVAYWGGDFEWTPGQERPKVGAGDTAADLSKCPQCGGEADNGHDRCVPPSAYMCSKCCAQEDIDRAST